MAPRRRDRRQRRECTCRASDGRANTREGELAPWREEEIIALLRTRTVAAGIEPTFARRLDKLPPRADEIDRHEALEQRAASYYRLLWDYAAGNPGVALHMWRRSLGSDDTGETHVRFFQAPDTADLERLPDQAVFACVPFSSLHPPSRMRSLAQPC